MPKILFTGPSRKRKRIKRKLIEEMEHPELRVASRYLQARGMYDEAERELRKKDPDGFCMALPGTVVFQHLNLSPRGKVMKWFSIHDPPTASAKVVGHIAGLVQTNATFVVGEAGYKQVSVLDKPKFVFAGAVGKLVAVDGAGGDEFGTVPSRDQEWIRYNPKKRDEGLIARWFCRQNPETGEWDIPVIKARRVVARGHRIYASGITDMPRKHYEPLLEQLGLGAYQAASIKLAHEDSEHGPHILAIHREALRALDGEPNT